jgi:hypothetical protein
MSSNEIRKIMESLECIVNESTDRISIGKQMARDGITYSRDREREIIGQIADYMEKNGYTKRQITYYMSYDEDFIPDVLGELPRESVMKEDSDVRGEIYKLAQEILKNMHTYDAVVDEVNDMFDAVKASGDQVAINAFKQFQDLEPEDFEYEDAGAGIKTNHARAKAQDAMDIIDGENDDIM